MGVCEAKMRTFRPDRKLRRQVTMVSHDPAVPPSDWVLTMSPDGLVVYKRHSKAAAARMTWRSILCHMITFGDRIDRKETAK